MERFKEFIKGYSISDHGRIRNDEKNTFRVLQDRDSRKMGYLSTHIIDKNYPVHRLVALHFVENPNPLEFNTVNHIDNNPRNNHFSNLEWTNQKGNMQHCLKQNRHTAQNCQTFKDQMNEKGKPSKVKRKSKDGMPIGVRKRVTKSGDRYDAFTRDVENQCPVFIGTFFSAYEAFEKVKQAYFSNYGVYPEYDGFLEKPEKSTQDLKNEKMSSRNINWELVREIRKSPLKHSILARELGISASTIKDIRYNKTWKE